MHLFAERRIPRSAGDVFDLIADASRNPDWQKGMVSCEWMTPPPIRIGSRYRQEARFLGRPVRSVFEVKGYETGHSISIVAVESTFPITVTRSVEPQSGESSVVRADISGGPKAPRLLAGLMRRIAQRSVDADYDRLVDLLST